MYDGNNKGRCGECGDMVRIFRNNPITQLTVYLFFIGYFIYQFSGVCLVHDPMKKEENGSLASSGSTTKWAT